MTTRPKPFVLVILDGWGHRDAVDHNPVQQVATPTFDDLYAHAPWTLLEASGEAVGLPAGQMGNSEVGHLHLGAGRKVPQDLTRIRRDIESGQFGDNPAIQDAIASAKQNGANIHILGLVSPGGVHSHENQIMALVDTVAKADFKHCYLHAILDGRDTPPQSALPSLQRFSKRFDELKCGRVASIIGRYYAMDRDKRWLRTEKAYDLLTNGACESAAANVEEGLMMAYQRGEMDEFVKPTCITPNGEKMTTIQDGDVVFFMNFRADRARQLSYALTQPKFNVFERKVRPKIDRLVTLTRYAENLDAIVAYPPLELKNTLGEALAKAGLTQLRAAETEKYAHVTYFLNGGVEAPLPAETRKLIPSPKVATYDLQPEMSAKVLTDTIVNAINTQAFDVIICNYANPDMVGHTGIESAAKNAVTVVDDCIKRIIKALKSVSGEALITADHGNIEQMYDDNTKQPHTAHTTNTVPLIYVGRPAHFNAKLGALDDVAPTLLHLLGLQPPPEMTGHNLLTLDGQ